MSLPVNSQPLISVIIPCYNHGAYLYKAIESILSQSYQNFEIIVIDDGSTDNSKTVAESYQQVNYFYQKNAGLSAARNKGIKKSKGELLTFLDADDWFFPGALAANLKYILQNPDIAFVSGAHEIFIESENKTWVVQKEVTADHYCHLLESNYIGMHATVLFQRWVFDLFKYNTSLKSCEDYDLYLKITRKFKIISHTEMIAVYRFHDHNMSGNFRMMLRNALHVLNKQKRFLTNQSEKDWYKKGIKFWNAYYTEKIYNQLNILLLNGDPLNMKDLHFLKIRNRWLYEKLIWEWKLEDEDVALKKALSEKFRNAWNNIRFPKKIKIQPDASMPERVNFGDFYRTTPFSTQFGYDRGGPVDRYYIENFLDKNNELIKGNVLEIGDNAYTLQFGKEKVIKSDILHIDEKNPNATYIGDLSNAPHVPDNSFDCIVLTQTLHLIYHHQKALETCYRVLKPGGVLLLTVPGISHIDQGEWKDIWYWAFTQSAVTKMLSEVFPIDYIQTETHGNVLVATAFLYGLGLPELKTEQMEIMDPHYQVIITATATKPEKMVI